MKKKNGNELLKVYATFEAEMYEIFEEATDDLIGNACTYDELHTKCEENNWELVSCTGLD